MREQVAKLDPAYVQSRQFEMGLADFSYIIGLNPKFVQGPVQPGDDVHYYAAVRPILPARTATEG